MKRGFTLSEVILGLALLAMMALGLLALVISGVKLSGQNRQGLLSAKLAQQFLENVRDRSLTLPAAAQTFDGKAGDPPVAGFPPRSLPKNRHWVRGICPTGQTPAGARQTRIALGGRNRKLARRNPCQPIGDLFLP